MKNGDVKGGNKNPAGASLLHTPVLLDKFMMAVSPVQGTWVDCTFGAGGFSMALVNAGARKVLAVDKDPTTEELGRNCEAMTGGRLRYLTGNFADFDKLPEIKDMLPVDGVVFDLGVSSMQFESAARGFSFKNDGPLDMRMSGSGTTAEEIVNTESEDGLARIFRVYGEERYARRIAAKIVRFRRTGSLKTTKQLAGLVWGCVPARNRYDGIHPATRVFMALRIAVNDELNQLTEGLLAAERSLRAGGFLAVISFHSLEDRIVKRFLRSMTGRASVNRNFPRTKTRLRAFSESSRRPIVPDDSEIAENPRARSAKLRVATRTSAEVQDESRPLHGLDPATV